MADHGICRLRLRWLPRGGQLNIILHSPPGHLQSAVGCILASRSNILFNPVYSRFLERLLDYEPEWAPIPILTA